MAEMQPATVEIVKQERWNSATLYHIQVRSALGYKEVRDKQYPHFEDLHRKLVLKRLPVPVPDLPPRKPAGDKKQRVEIIRRGLEDFINILLTQPPTAGDEAVCAFLQIPAVAALHGLGVRDDLQYSPPPVPQQQAPMTTPPLQQRPEGSEGTGAGMVSASELRMAWEAVESQQSNQEATMDAATYDRPFRTPPPPAMNQTVENDPGHGGVAGYARPSTPLRISTPPLPTQHTDMKADGLDNGNSAVHFAVVNQADAGAHNIDHKEFKDFFGYSPSVSQQIRKEEEADEDVDTFDEIVDIPPAQESTASHSRPPKAPGQSLSKPPGFEDYALSPTSNATQTELLHRFDLNKLISSLPSVASPPMVSPEVQQRRGQLANPSSILQLVPAALMPDLEQMPTYGAPVSRLGPQDNLPAQTTSPSKLSTETSPPRIPASPTPDVHISHNPNPHSTAFDERPPSSNVPALNTLAEQQPTTQSGEQTSTEGGGKPYEGQYAGSTDQDQVAAWISDVIRETVSQPLEESLRSGVVLCTLINKLKPGTIGKVSRSTMPFPMRENIKAFCDACRALGVPDRDNFTTDDLFEQRNMKQVILCLLSLGRRSYQIPGYCGPCLGKPELANAGASKQSKFRIQTSTYR